MTDAILDGTEWETILERLRRIKALADRAGTLEEAEAATAALSRLLLRHNLSLAELSERFEREAGASGVLTQDYEVGNGALWRHYLLHVLAQCHFCRAIRFGRSPRATLIGHPHNLIVVKDLYLWLATAIDRLAAEAWEAEIDRLSAQILVATDAATLPRFADVRAKIAEAKKREKRTWLASFRTGAVDGIWQRLIDERSKLQAETPDAAWALVPVLEQEVDAALNAAFTRLGSYRPVATSPVGYRAGRQAGYAIDVGVRQMGEGPAGT